MSKESLKKSLKQESKKDEAEVIQESEMELNLEDLDNVAGGNNEGTRKFLKLFPTESDPALDKPKY